MQSCFLTFPDCFGCESAGSLLCFEAECLTCKCVSRILKFAVFSIKKRVCQANNVCGMMQFFFFDFRCAFPCNEKVPCVCSALPSCRMCSMGRRYVVCKMEDIIKN